MCSPLNEIIWSLRSFLLPFLLLIFMSKQIFRTIFNLILNRGVWETQAGDEGGENRAAD